MTRTFVASAPGRSGIIGNPSDIYGGFLVSSSINVRNECQLIMRETRTKLPEDRRLWDAVTQRFPLKEAVRVDLLSAVPRSSGMAGSTAMLAAILACVLAARGETPELETVDQKCAFAELVRDIESNEAGIVCGYQDAYMAVFGGVHALNFVGKHPAVDGGPYGQLEAIDVEPPCLLVTTGVERLSGSVHGPLKERWQAGEPLVVESMNKIADLGRQGRNAILAKDWGALGGLMTENHRLVAAMGGSGEAIDSLVQKCLDFGALSAKLAGAGLGGTVIALTESQTSLETLQTRLVGSGYTAIHFPQTQPGLMLNDLANQGPFGA